MKNNNNVSEVSETIENFRKEKAFIKTLNALYGTNAEGGDKMEWIESKIYVKPPYTGVINISGVSA